MPDQSNEIQAGPPTSVDAPFRTGAPVYAAAGWHGVIYAERHDKVPQPGVTGYEGKLTTPEEYVRTSKSVRHGRKNISLRLAPGYVGIDVDAYGGKHGGQTLEALEAELGPLPDAPVSTSKDDGVSGIRIFRVPEGIEFRGDFGPGSDIEIVQFHHRHVTVWPSVHPKTGAKYRWDGCEDVVPLPDEVPALDAPWIERMRKPEPQPATPFDLSEPVPGWVAGAVASKIAEVRDAPEGAGNTTLNRAAFMIGQYIPNGWVDRGEVEAQLNAAIDSWAKPYREGPEKIARALTEGEQEAYRKRAKAPAVPAQRGKDTRARVDIGSKATVTDWLRQEMGRGALSSLFLRDGMIVHTPRIGEDGYVPPSEGEAGRGIHPGPAQVRPVTQDGVKALVEVRYDVGKVDEDKKTGEQRWVRTLLPRETVVSAYSAAQMGEGVPNMRELYGITHTPAMRQDGTVLDTPGYDASTGLLYLPERGVRVPAVPERPTAQQVKEAVELLLRPVEQFPFLEESHRANWLGLMMTPALRSLLPPPYPMGIATATNPGSGKGFLMGMIRIVHGGALRGEMPREGDELRKSITAALIDTTAPVVQFDNLRGVVHSAVLEALLTSATHSDRLLGFNKSVDLVNDRLWVATGNNVKIGGDLARRCLFVAIDPGMADPHLRTGFRLHPLRWVTENRGIYLAAILTVARAWVLAGAPSDVTRSDDFAQWHGALRGMLTWAGVPGLFGGDSTDISAASEDDAEWSEFLAALHQTFEGGPFTAAQVVARVESVVKGIAPELLPGDLAEKHGRMGGAGSLTKSLGRWLSNRDGRYADGWVCKGRKVGKKATTYTVVPPAGHVAEPLNPFD